MNVVVLSNIDWSFLRQRHHYVAEAFLERGDSVVFVESTGKRLPTMSDAGRLVDRVLNRSPSRACADQTGHSNEVKIISPIALPSTARLFNWVNRRFFLRRLSRSIHRCLDETCDVLVYAFLPTSSTNTLVDMLRPQAVVYDCVSNYQALEAASPGITRSEAELIERADLVLVDCEFLRSKHRASAQRIAILEPMVSYEEFSSLQGKTPERIRTVAYFGLFDSHKLDLEAVARLARAVGVTVIGPVGRSVQRESSITYVDEVAHGDLPGHLARVDGLLLPYNDAEFTKGIMPAKFYECLATGLPVFALRTPNFEAFGDCIYLADDAEGLVEQVRAFDPALDVARRERRIALARKRDAPIGKRELRHLIDQL